MTVTAALTYSLTYDYAKKVHNTQRILIYLTSVSLAYQGPAPESFLHENPFNKII